MKRSLGLLLPTLLAVPLSLVASQVGPLVTFSNGAVASASDVNGNFAALTTAVNDNATRLTAVEGGNLPVGSVVQSMLTLAQFQTQAGSGWVLAAGQGCAGSTYASLTGASTVPDLRGVALRGKDNGRGLNPDGDIALGTYQADAFRLHTHVQDAHNHTQNAHSHPRNPSSIGENPNVWPTPSGNGIGMITTGGNQFLQAVTSTGSATATNVAATATNQNTGGNETRMKTVTVNTFIRID